MIVQLAEGERWGGTASAEALVDFSGGVRTQLGFGGEEGDEVLSKRRPDVLRDDPRQARFEQVQGGESRDVIGEVRGVDQRAQGDVEQVADAARAGPSVDRDGAPELGQVARGVGATRQGAAHGAQGDDPEPAHQQPHVAARWDEVASMSASRLVFKEGQYAVQVALFSWGRAAHPAMDQGLNGDRRAQLGQGPGQDALDVERLDQRQHLRGRHRANILTWAMVSDRIIFFGHRFFNKARNRCTLTTHLTRVAMLVGSAYSATRPQKKGRPSEGRPVSELRRSLSMTARECYCAWSRTPSMTWMMPLDAGMSRVVIVAPSMVTSAPDIMGVAVSPLAMVNEPPAVIVAATSSAVRY